MSDRIPSEESLSAEQLPDIDHEEMDSQEWLNALRDYQKAIAARQTALSAGRVPIA